MAHQQPQTLTIVTCKVTPKPSGELTEFDVTVRGSESDAPFRLRTDRGMPLKLINFGASATVGRITDLLKEGTVISVPLEMIGARWQKEEDGFQASDRAVKPREIRPAGRRTFVTDAKPLSPSMPRTTPVGGGVIIQFNRQPGSRPA